MNLLTRIRRKIVNRLRFSRTCRSLRQVLFSVRRFGDRYTPEDHTVVTLYTDHPEVFPGYQPSRPLQAERGKRGRKVSLVITARNERENVARLLESLQAQSRIPDEIVIVDTGSSDGTLELLQAGQAQGALPLKIILEPGANIARGRNRGIATATHEIIAVTDFGCELPPHWLEALVAPFEADATMQVAAGRYQAVDGQGRPARWLLGHRLEQIQPQAHLPSGVSVAFRKDAWAALGGYPEWLTLTGEDTYFALELKRSTRAWAFVPEAVVYWEAPQTFRSTLRKTFVWSIGDGEAGTNARAYRWAVLKVGSLAAGLVLLTGLFLTALLPGWLPLRLGAALLALAVLVGMAYRYYRRGESLKGMLTLTATYSAEILGFLRGYLRRPAVDRRRYQQVRGIFFILAGVPMDDTGGGARWTQIALELLRRGYLVVFLNKFPKYESVELDLHFRHPNLITAPLDAFRWERLAASLEGILGHKPLTALVELPLADFEPLIAHLRHHGGTVIYDLLDDWKTALGGSWYTPQAEQRIIAASQVLSATAVPLAERLRQHTGRPVHLLPNAVNSFLFNPARRSLPPADLPAAAWRVIYTGALWGEWFDWELLKAIAQTYPEAAVVAIGDYAGQCHQPPSNLHFLGLKPQRELPAYLAHADVAIIPWKVNPITQATSPLKVYEYIAMHKPVVAPALEPLRGLPGVTLAANPQDFVARVGVARQGLSAERVTEMDTFVRANHWGARVDALLAFGDKRSA